MTFIINNLGTIIVCLILAACVFLAVRKIIIDLKKGKYCGSCSNCTGCTGGGSCCGGGSCSGGFRDYTENCPQDYTENCPQDYIENCPQDYTESNS